MTLTELTFGLSALILGLALTHLAAALSKLLLARERVRWAPEPLDLGGHRVDGDCLRLAQPV